MHQQSFEWQTMARDDALGVAGPGSRLGRRRDPQCQWQPRSGYSANQQQLDSRRSAAGQALVEGSTPMAALRPVLQRGHGAVAFSERLGSDARLLESGGTISQPNRMAAEEVRGKRRCSSAGQVRSMRCLPRRRERLPAGGKQTLKWRHGQSLWRDRSVGRSVRRVAAGHAQPHNADCECHCGERLPPPFVPDDWRDEGKEGSADKGPGRIDGIQPHPDVRIKAVQLRAQCDVRPKGSNTNQDDTRHNAEIACRYFNFRNRSAQKC